MAEFIETPTKTFTAGAAIAQHLRVKLSAGVLALAGASDADIGVTEWPALATGDDVAVRLRNAQGTVKMIAADSFAAGADIYAAANGRIDDSGTILIGTTLDAASNAGDIVEVLRGNPQDIGT